MAMDLPSRVETDDGGARLPVVIPTPEQTETMKGILKAMVRWTEEMQECAAAGDLLRLMHLSNTVQENNGWLAGYVDKVMDVRT